MEALVDDHQGLQQFLGGHTLQDENTNSRD